MIQNTPNNLIVYPFCSSDEIYYRYLKTVYLFQDKRFRFGLTPKERNKIY